MNQPAAPGSGPLRVLMTDGAASPGRPERPERDLLSFVTHEIGNQLTVIHGFAEMLSDGIDTLSKDMVRQFSDAIVRNALDMRMLVQSISDLRQLDAGGLQIQRQAVDLVPLVVGTVDRWRPRLDPRPVSVALPDRLVASVEGERFEQVLAHLLANVVDHTPVTSAVAVRLGVAGDGAVELSVADQGPGIPPERVAEAFERFSRVGPGVKGAGVGLYLARAIARAHDGDLVLDEGDGGCRLVLRISPAAPGRQLR